jgi:hypothetical protein
MRKVYLLLFVMIPGLVFPGLVSSQSIDVKLGNDTTLCKGSIMILEPSVTLTADMQFYWNDELEPSSKTLSITKGGKYWVRVVDTRTGFLGSDTIIVSEVELPEFSLDIPVPPAGYFCKGELVEIKTNATEPGWIYLWEGVNSTISTAKVDTTGEYGLKVVDENRCERTRSVNIEFQYPYEEDRLLLATWDPLIEKNILIWRSSAGKRTSAFIISRGDLERDELGRYPFESVNLAVDNVWDPRSGPSIYNCQVVDSCENRSSFSNIWAHTTLHLQVERLAEPAGATQLTWNNYKGFGYDNFYIRRGTSPDNMEIIATVPYDGRDKVTFTDPTLATDKYYYQVLVNTPEIIYLRNTQGKKASAGPFVHSLSNLEENWEGTGIDAEFHALASLKVFPNPYSGHTNIYYTLTKPGNIRLEIVNLLGQKVLVLQDGAQEQGDYKQTFSARELGLPAGMYYLRYEYNNMGVVTRKLIER